MKVAEGNNEVDAPEMVKVMEFRGGQEGEVVSTVGDGGADQSNAVPHAGGGDVGAQDDRPHDHREQVGELQQGEKRNTRLRVLTVRNPGAEPCRP